jgi:hypothetical protein
LHFSTRSGTLPARLSREADWEGIHEALVDR